MRMLTNSCVHDWFTYMVYNMCIPRVYVTPVSQLLSLSSTAYIKEEDITDMFHPDIILTSTVKQTFHQVSNKLDTIV